MSETHSVEEIKKHVKLYLMVFGGLLVLTVVTVAVGYLELAIGPAVILGLLIACLKAGLVAAYFMHLKGERKVITYTLILTVVFFLCMVALFVSLLADQVTL